MRRRTRGVAAPNHGQKVSEHTGTRGPNPIKGLRRLDRLACSAACMLSTAPSLAARSRSTFSWSRESSSPTRARILVSVSTRSVFSDWASPTHSSTLQPGTPGLVVGREGRRCGLRSRQVQVPAWCTRARPAAPGRPAAGASPHAQRPAWVGGSRESLASSERPGSHPGREEIQEVSLPEPPLPNAFPSAPGPLPWRSRPRRASS